MVINSLSHLPFEVESDFPDPATCAGLSDLLVQKRSEKVMGFQQVLWNTCSLKHPVCIAIIMLWRAHATWGGEDMWRCSGQQPQLSPAFMSLQPSWHVSEEAPDDPSPESSESKLALGSSELKPQILRSKDKPSLLCPDWIPNPQNLWA